MHKIESNNNTMQYLLNTYKAFVEVIIPWTPKLASEYGEMQYYGAIDLLTYEFLIVTLYEYGGNSLVIATANNLDVWAQQFVLQGKNLNKVNTSNGVYFADLVPSDRLLVINNIKQYESKLSSNQIASIDTLIRFTMMGYYSEWYGYGSTRLKEPNQRVMEFAPLSWQQIEYPGPNKI
jgi:hypothetical protein